MYSNPYFKIHKRAIKHTCGCVRHTDIDKCRLIRRRQGFALQRSEIWSRKRANWNSKVFEFSLQAPLKATPFTVSLLCDSCCLVMGDRGVTHLWPATTEYDGEYCTVENLHCARKLMITIEKGQLITSLVTTSGWGGESSATMVCKMSWVRLVR